MPFRDNYDKKLKNIWQFSKESELNGIFSVLVRLVFDKGFFKIHKRELLVEGRVLFIY